MDVAQRLLELGVDEVCIGDTIGVAVPGRRPACRRRACSARGSRPNGWRCTSTTRAARRSPTSRCARARHSLLRRVDRGHRRLSVRAGGGRQPRHRGPRLPARSRGDVAWRRPRRPAGGGASGERDARSAPGTKVGQAGGWRYHRRPMEADGPARRPLILDVDTGIDDMIALLIAATSPELALRGVTCVAGNVEIHHVARNTARSCAWSAAATCPSASARQDHCSVACARHPTRTDRPAPATSSCAARTARSAQPNTPRFRPAAISALTSAATRARCRSSRSGRSRTSRRPRCRAPTSTPVHAR